MIPPVVLQFLMELVEHEDLIGLALEAVRKGVDKATLMRLVREALVAASDTEMRKEMGG